MLEAAANENIIIFARKHKMAFNNIMQLATATLTAQDAFAPGATVVEWGNQRFRYSEDWLNECEKII